MLKLYDFILTAIILISLDVFTLNLLFGFFREQIKLIQGSPIKLNMFSAVLCYLILVCGLYYFIISKKKTIVEAFFLGIVIYAVYELTNKSIFTKWQWKTVFIDTLWGGTLYAITTAIVYRLI